MKIPPKYQITSEMIDLISKIEANLYYLSLLKLNSTIKNKIIKLNILQSSLFSAKIEGNPLELNDLTNRVNVNDKNEIFNIVKATKYIQKTVKKNLLFNKQFLLDLHSLVMSGRLNLTKNFRKQIGAIFNKEGAVVYLSPPPNKIDGYINQLIDYTNNQEKNLLINSFVSHLIFEKIHPFIDGNGRVGRLLILAIILRTKSKDYFFIPFEKHLEKKRQDYYYFLDNGLKNTEDYLIFMLKTFYEASKELKTLIENEKNKKILLPPRQEEIYLIIKDHQLVSFDQIKRRFLKIPERTLRYDLKKLVDKKLIIKIGITKGSYYRIK